MSKKIKIFLAGCLLMVMCSMGITAGASEDAKAEVVAHNLTITDAGINVNFYVNIQGDVQVTLNGTQVDVPNTTEKIIIDAKAYNCYKFTQPVVAKEMDKDVSLVIKSGDEPIVEDSYCVNDYAASVIGAQYNYNYEELVKAMTYYGDFAEVYLNYDAKQADEATAFLQQFDNAAKTDLINNYGMTKVDTVEGVTPTQIQLNLVSEVAIRLRFNVSDAAKNSEFKAVSEDGTKTLELKEGTDNNGTYYYVDIENIGADALDKPYEIQVNDTTVLSNCSALSYARAVVKGFVDEEGNITEGKADLVNLAKALYLYNQKAKTYVDCQATAVCDIFYNGTGFYADPEFTKAVYLTDNNNDVTTKETSNQVTTLEDLNDSRTKGCTIWMQTAYTVTGTEELTGPYVIRRYKGNTGNVLNVTGTATFETTVDGSEGKFVAQYPGGTTDEFEISNVANGDVYVSGALTVKGSAKSGLITTSTVDVIITADGLTKDAKIIFPDHTTQKLTGTGEVSAITLVNHGQGHFGAIKKSDNTLTLGSIICVCGKNVNEHTESCAWTGEGNDISKVYDIKWQPYASASGALPGSGTAGYYYLTKDFTLSRSDVTTVSYLDLNGKTITASNSWNIRIESADANYSIADSKGNGTIKLPENHEFAVWGALVFYNYAGTFTVYSGTIDMTNATGVEFPLIDVNKGAFIMHGGVVKGAKSKVANSNCLGARGTGTITITGGTVYGDVLLQTAANTLTVGGNAKVGLPLDGITGNGIFAWVDNTKVIGDNLTSNAQIVFNSGAHIDLSATGVKEAFIVPCDYEIYDNNGKWSMRIVATDHTEETIPGKAATCTETGLTDGTKCSVCGKTLVAQKVIPATGHDYYEPTEDDLAAMIAVGDKVVVGKSVVAELTALESEKNTYKLYCLRCVDSFTVVELDVIGEEDGKQFENDNEASYDDAWSVVDTFNTSTHDTSLTQLGQDIYSTGKNFLATSSMTIDGTLNTDEGWVCVTPNYVTKTLANTYMGAGSNSGYDSSSVITHVTSGAAVDNADYMPDIKYYVAQSEGSSDEYIHVAFEVIAPSVEIDGWVGQFRLGFNPNDYTQQLILYANAPSDALVTKGMSDNSTVTLVSTTAATTAFTQAVLTSSAAKNGVYEITLSKTQLKAAYLAVFNTTLTDADLNTMFVGISLRIRLNNNDIARPYYGTLLTPSAASSAGENTVIPDVIVFGEEKDTDSAAYSSCSFTGHSIEDRYLVAGTTDTYYHACTHCGMAGAKAFKMDGDTIVCE